MIDLEKEMIEKTAFIDNLTTNFRNTFTKASNGGSFDSPINKDILSRLNELVEYGKEFLDEFALVAVILVQKSSIDFNEEDLDIKMTATYVMMFEIDKLFPTKEEKERFMKEYFYSANELH